MQQMSYTPSNQPSAQQRNYQSSVHQSSMYQGSAANGPRLITGGAMSSSAGPERVQSTRKISSTIVDEQMMGPPPTDYPTREVEVPGPVEEKIIHVPRREVIETEVRVPKYEYEYVDRIVEVPRIEYVDRVVEVPQYQDVVVEKKVTKWVDVPREVIREVKVPKINYIDRTVEVPGEIIEVPKPYTVEQKVEFTRYTDMKKAVVVAQSVKPVIVEGAGVTEVDVYEYEPECVPVDVHVVKGVQAQIQAGGVLETRHRVVTVPTAQYNTILQQMNSHLSQAELQKLPYLTERGQTVFLNERIYTADVQAGAAIEGLDMNNLVTTYVDHASRRVLPINTQRSDLQMSASQMATAHSGGANVVYRQEQHYPVSSGFNRTMGQQQSADVAMSSGVMTMPSGNLAMQPTPNYLYSSNSNTASNVYAPQQSSTPYVAQQTY